MSHLLTIFPFKQLQPYWAFCLFVGRRCNAIRVWQVAASLTFTTLLALVPVLTITLVLISAFPMFNEIKLDFMALINNLIMPSGAVAMWEYFNQFNQQAKKLTLVGILMMLLTSLLLIQTIDQTFNRIWRVRKPRSAWLQFPMYWALLTFMPIVLGVGISVIGQSLGISGSLKPFIWFIFNVIVFYLLYSLVPNRFVPQSHAWIGASLTAILLKLTKLSFDGYIHNFNNYQLIYGAFSAIPVFLVWLHLLWAIILLGAVLTASLSYWQGAVYLQNTRQKTLFNDIVQILLMLRQAQREGKTLKVKHFRPYVSMGYDELGDILDQLEDMGYIASHKHSWLLQKSLEHITLAELVKQFVYTTSPINSPIQHALNNLMNPNLSSLNMTLDEFERQHIFPSGSLKP